MTIYFFLALFFKLPAESIETLHIVEEDRFSVEGQSRVPLFYINRPFFRDSLIYLPSIYGHQVVIYDRQTAELRAVGRKGQGPGEFNLPYGVRSDRSGNLYVNDRSNMRIQVFDSEFAYLKSIPIAGQCESFFTREKGSGTTIQMIGTYPCDSGTCLVQSQDAASGVKRSFAPLNREPSVFSWATAQNTANGNIAVANILEPELRIYAENGVLLKEMMLRSPDWIGIDAPRGNADARRRAIMSTLRTGTYTTIERLLLDEDRILVQLKRWASGKADKYLLQIYDHRGRLLAHGFESEDILGDFVDRDTLWFYRVDETTNENGTVHFTLKSLE